MANLIPNRLKRNNRSEYQCFKLHEKLYRRFTEQLFADDGKMYANAIRFPDISVNREKFGQPLDVLFPNFFNNGIFAFKAKDIPTPICLSIDNKYEFCVFHRPLEDNYPHCEIISYKNNLQLSPTKKIGKTVKAKFRHILGEKLEIIKQPDGKKLKSNLAF